VGGVAGDRFADLGSTEMATRARSRAWIWCSSVRFSSCFAAESLKAI
jgi:hypothetical protein